MVACTLKACATDKKGKEMPASSGAFQVLDGYPEDVVAIAAKGHITARDYETTLIPLVKARIAAKGKVKLLYMLGADFDGISMGAAWDDARLGLMHWSDFARVAVVTDIDWIRWSLKVFAPMIPCPVHVFHNAELAAAKAWISEYR